MKKFLIVSIISAAAVIQIAVGGTGPNLILVLFLAAAVFMGFEKTWWWVVLTGLFLDFFSGLAFGSISLSLALSCFAVDWFNHKVFLEIRLWTTLVLVALGSLIYYFILTVFHFSFDSHYLFSSFVAFLAVLLYNLVLTIVVFYGVKKIFN